MGRLILIGIIVVLLVWLLRRALAKPAEAKPKADAQGDLVACAHCGVNLPKPEARSAGGHYFCSEEHWRAGPRER